MIFYIYLYIKFKYILLDHCNMITSSTKIKINLKYVLAAVSL